VGNAGLGVTANDGFFYDSAGTQFSLDLVGGTITTGQFGLKTGYTNTNSALIQAFIDQYSDVTVSSAPGVYYFNVLVDGNKRLRGVRGNWPQVHHYGNAFCFNIQGNEARVDGLRIPGKVDGFEYDSGESYAVGNTCLNGSNYYQCNTDTTGAFNAADWDDLGSSCEFGGVFVDGFNQASSHCEIANIRGTGGAGYGFYIVSEDITPVVQWLTIQDSRWSQCGHAALRVEGNCLEVNYVGSCQFTGGGGLGATSALTDLGANRPASPSYNYRKGSVEFLAAATATDTWGSGHPSRVTGDFIVNGDLDQMQNVDTSKRTCVMYVSGLGQANITGSIENPYPGIFFANEISESGAQNTATGNRFKMRIGIVGGNIPDNNIAPIVNTGGHWGTVDCVFAGSGSISGAGGINGALYHNSYSDGDMTGDIRLGEDNELILEATDLFTSATVKGNFERFEEIGGFCEIRAHSGTYRYAAKTASRIWVQVPTSTWELSALSRRRASYRGQFAPGETVIISTDPALNDGSANLTIRHNETDPDTAALGVGRFITSDGLDVDLTAETDQIKFEYNDELLAWRELWRNF
jgi:hypothetical protein